MNYYLDLFTYWCGISVIFAGKMPNIPWLHFFQTFDSSVRQNQYKFIWNGIFKLFHIIQGDLLLCQHFLLRAWFKNLFSWNLANESIMRLGILLTLSSCFTWIWNKIFHIANWDNRMFCSGGILEIVMLHLTLRQPWHTPLWVLSMTLECEITVWYSLCRVNERIRSHPIRTIILSTTVFMEVFLFSLSVKIVTTWWHYRKRQGYWNCTLEILTPTTKAEISKCSDIFWGEVWMTILIN